VTFVPPDFDPPQRLVTPEFELEPLGPEHNESDYAAWSTSIEHIHTLQGFVGSRWPREMTREDNLRDLERHAADFAARTGFTYTVREPDGGPVIGCVYIYPRDDDADGAQVRSWVTARRAELDAPVRAAVRDWLDTAWPFATIDY
jgi:RimJ/RimL family protein N-acetyltransferase